MLCFYSRFEIGIFITSFSNFDFIVYNVPMKPDTFLQNHREPDRIKTRERQVQRDGKTKIYSRAQGSHCARGTARGARA